MHAPVEARVGAGQHADIAGRAFHYVEPFEVERDAHRLFRGQVVVHQRGDHQLIALHEEARHSEAQDEILAHDGFRRRGADAACPA